MAHGRLSKLWSAVSLAAGVILLSTGLSVWQHEMMMQEMMGGRMWGMMWWVYLPVVIAALILIVIPVTAYLFAGGRETPVLGLTDEEKNVVDYLSRSGGMAEQRAISKALGLSRLKTHRLIASLRRREIVEVEPRGRTNLVKLKNAQKSS